MRPQKPDAGQNPDATKIHLLLRAGDKNAGEYCVHVTDHSGWRCEVGKGRGNGKYGLNMMRGKKKTILGLLDMICENSLGYAGC